MALIVYSFVIGLCGGLVSGLAAVAMIWKQLAWLRNDLALIQERLERLERPSAPAHSRQNISAFGERA